MLKIKEYNYSYAGNYMDCPQCVTEHNHMLKTEGYGYSYIGNRMNCYRHQNINSNNKQTNNLPIGGNKNFYTKTPTRICK